MMHREGQTRSAFIQTQQNRTEIAIMVCVAKFQLCRVAALSELRYPDQKVISFDSCYTDDEHHVTLDQTGMY